MVKSHLVRAWLAASVVGLAALSTSPARAADAPATDASPAPEAVELATAVKVLLLESNFVDAAARLDTDGCALLAASPSAAADVVAAIVQSWAAALGAAPDVAAVLRQRLDELTSASATTRTGVTARAARDLLDLAACPLDGRTASADEVRAAVAAVQKAETPRSTAPSVLPAVFDVAALVARLRPASTGVWATLLAVAEPIRPALVADDRTFQVVALAELAHGTALAAAEPVRAKATLERGLGAFQLRGWARPAPGAPPTPITAVFNRALTQARRLGGAAKVDYVTKPFASRGRVMHASVPAAVEWTWTYTTSDQDYGRIVCDRGAAGKIEIQLWGYNGWTEYTMPDGAVIPGENLDGFLKAALKADREFLTGITRDARSNGPLNGAIKQTKGYELKGVSVDGVPTRFRSWYFNSPRALKRFYTVALTQTGPIDDKDPELDFVLDSIGCD